MDRLVQDDTAMAESPNHDSWNHGLGCLVRHHHVPFQLAGQFSDIQRLHYGHKSFRPGSPLSCGAFPWSVWEDSGQIRDT